MMFPFLCSFGELCLLLGLFNSIPPTSCDFPKLPHTAAHLFLFPSLDLLPLLYHLHVDWVRHLVCLPPLPTQGPQQLILVSSSFSSLQSWRSCRAQSAQGSDSRLKETNQPTTQTYTFKYIQGFFPTTFSLKHVHWCQLYKNNATHLNNETDSFTDSLLYCWASSSQPLSNLSLFSRIKPILIMRQRK